MKVRDLSLSFLLWFIIDLFLVFPLTSKANLTFTIAFVSLPNNVSKDIHNKKKHQTEDVFLLISILYHGFLYIKDLYRSIMSTTNVIKIKINNI